MSRHDASRLTYDEVTILGVPALFTDLRVNCSTATDGVYRYELRYSDDYGGEPVELARGIMVDFFGTVLTREPIQLPIGGWLELNEDDLVFVDGGCSTLQDFQKKYPVSEKGVIDFYIADDTTLHNLCFSQNEEQDKDAGCVGHLRGDFGSGKQFYTTWWPQNDTLNTPEFKADIDRAVNWLREQPDSPLRDFDTMKRCCDRYKRVCVIKQALSPSCGFMVKTKQYVYMLRCTPVKGDYNFYMYCYQREAFEKYREQLKSKTHSHAQKRIGPER